MAWQNRRATDEATLADWSRRHEAGETWDTIGHSVGLTAEQVRKQVSRARPKSPTVAAASSPPDETSVIFPDLKERADEEAFATRYLDVVIQQQQLEKTQDNEQDVARAEIKDNRPVGIIPTGDWHIGNTHTDHALLREYLDLIRATDGVHMVGMGDYCDWFIGRMIRLAVTEQQFKPAQQRAIARDLLVNKTGGRGKVLTLLAGNHCWKPEELTGEDPVADVASDAKVPYLGYGGILHIGIGEQQYKTSYWHSYPGGSAINPGNNNRRLRNDYQGLDVNCLGHYHYNYAQDGTTREGQDYVDLRSGSLKVRDARYAAMRVGTKGGDARMPMFILFPKQHKIWHVRDFRDWLPLLAWLRSGGAA